jgi:hypothetical protein
MIIDKLGFYKTRSGEVVEVVTIVDPRVKATQPVLFLRKYVDHCHYCSIDGKFYFEGNEHFLDLVEYLGTELPKPKQKVRLYQAIMKAFDEEYYFTTTGFYRSADGVKKQYGHSYVFKFPANPDFYVEVEK